MIARFPRWVQLSRASPAGLPEKKTRDEQGATRRGIKAHAGVLGQAAGREIVGRIECCAGEGATGERGVTKDVGFSGCRQQEGSERTRGEKVKGK